jgi:hypothetical protein
MKKKIATTTILTFIMAAMVLPANAQHISAGIKGGLTMSNLYIEEDGLNDENARFGFHAGLFSQFMYRETFGIQPELLFTNKGSKATYGGLINQTVDFNLNYLEIPVMFVFRPFEILEVHAGPYVGLLFNANIEYSGTIDGYDEIDRDYFNTLDYGIGAGLAMNFGIMQIGIRYNIGLQKLAKSDIANFLLGESQNSFGQLYLALRLRN